MSILSRVVESIQMRTSTQDEDPELVYQWGGTAAMSFLREAQIGTLGAPALFDQKELKRVLRYLLNWFLPAMDERWYREVGEVFALLDDTLLSCLRDPNSTSDLPTSFTENPLVKDSLAHGMPMDKVLTEIITASRLFCWLYKDFGASNFIPTLLELELPHTTRARMNWAVRKLSLELAMVALANTVWVELSTWGEMKLMRLVAS